MESEQALGSIQEFKALQEGEGLVYSPGHHQNGLYGDVMRNANMAAKARQAVQSPFRALFVA